MVSVSNWRLYVNSGHRQIFSHILLSLPVTYRLRQPIIQLVRAAESVSAGGGNKNTLTIPRTQLFKERCLVAESIRFVRFTSTFQNLQLSSLHILTKTLR